MVKHDEVHGERADRQERAAKRLLLQLGVAVTELDRWINESPDGEHYVVQVSFKVRYDSVGDVLAVVLADTVNGREVAFNSGNTFAETLLALTNRLNNGQIKWKEDTPYGDRSNNGAGRAAGTGGGDD
jgi:hypothetical protein